MAWLWTLCLALEVFSPSAAWAEGGIQFQKKKMSVGSVVLTVEIADTPERQSRGLMYRTKLADGEGMLFMFDEERTQSFWMKNTYVPLDIGFFDRNRKLVDIQRMKPVKSAVEIPESYRSESPAQYALEVPQGWFERHKIKKGTRFKLD